MSNAMTDNEASARGKRIAVEWGLGPALGECVRIKQARSAPARQWVMNGRSGSRMAAMAVVTPQGDDAFEE